jgi:MFS family permease
MSTQETADRAVAKDRDIWPFYAFVAFGGFLPYLAILPYLYLTVGLSLAQITWLTAAGNMAIVLLEVPTGALADKLGRKVSLIIGMVLGVTGIVLTIALPKVFLTFLAWVVVHAAGIACISGADQALLYDRLATTGRREKFHGIIGRYAGLGRACGFFATVAAGPLLAHGGFNLVLAVALAAQVAALAAACRMPQETLKATRERPPFSEILRKSWHEIRNSPALLFCLAFSATLLTTAGLVWEYRSLLVAEKIPTNPEIVVGLTAALTLVFALSMFLAGYTKKALVRDRHLISYLALPLGIIGAALLPGWWGLTMLAVYVLAGGIFNVRFRVLINDAIPTPELRATILSTANLADRMAYTMFALGFGLVATIGFAPAMAGSGVLLIILYGVLLYARGSARRASQGRVGLER